MVTTHTIKSLPAQLRAATDTARRMGEPVAVLEVTPPGEAPLRFYPFMAVEDVRFWGAENVIAIVESDRSVEEFPASEVVSQAVFQSAFMGD